MSLFDNTNQNDQVQIDPNKNYLEDLVGEGKKFKSIEDLARGKAEADMYIEHFKQRQDELRQDYERLKTEYEAGPKLKELIDQIAQNKQSQGDAMNQDVREDKPVDLSKIEELVEQRIQLNRQRERENENFSKVEKRLQQEYGPNYKAMLKSTVDTLGLDESFVDDLARRSPDALFRTLGLDGQRRTDNFQSPPPSTTRPDQFSPDAQKRTWSYYQKMRKENPIKYRDPKTQDQMFRDAVALGPAFEDGDWNSLGH